MPVNHLNLRTTKHYFMLLHWKLIEIVQKGAKRSYMDAILVMLSQFFTKQTVIYSNTQSHRNMPSVNQLTDSL